MNVCVLLSLLLVVVVGTAKALRQRHVLRRQTYACANVWQRYCAHQASSQDKIYWYINKMLIALDRSTYIMQK